MNVVNITHAQFDSTRMPAVAEGRRQTRCRESWKPLRQGRTPQITRGPAKTHAMRGIWPLRASPASKVIGDNWNRG